MSSRRRQMFLGVGFRSERLLVRVGEDAVESALAVHPAGVTRCTTELPGRHRTFPGTLMIDLEQFRGAKLREWYELAMAYNGTLKAKESSARPRKKQAAAVADQTPVE